MMPQLLETICCQDGQLLGLPFHQDRVRRSARALGSASFPNLQHIQVPNWARKGRFKCRVVYREYIEKIEFTPYRIRSVKRLKLVSADHIDYDCKYADRELINAAFGQRGEADDVLFVKHGWLTDTSYANIALWDGSQWVTPEHPLLEGTRRSQLLQQHLITPRKIHVNELYKFEQITLFNAMMDLGEGPVIAVQPTNISQNYPFTKK